MVGIWKENVGTWDGGIGDSTAVPRGDGIIGTNASNWGDGRVGEPGLTIGGEDRKAGVNATDDHGGRANKGEYGFGAIAIGIIFLKMTYLFFHFAPFKSTENNRIKGVSDVGTYI